MYIYKYFVHILTKALIENVTTHRALMSFIYGLLKTTSLSLFSNKTVQNSLIYVI